MAGHVSGALVDANRERFLAELRANPAPHWLFDLLGLRGFDAAAMSAGGAWWRAFKDQGGTHVIFATQYSAARMAATALGFSVGVKLVVCTSVDEARAALAALPTTAG